MTLDIPPELVLVLDALRKKRNLTDYSGDLIDPASLRECLLHAGKLVDLASRLI